MGNLFVGRQPLHESPMKDHPLTPMRDSNLMRLLEPQVTRPVGLIDRLTVAHGAEAVRAGLAKLAEDGVAHVVVDAVADADLHVIAEACRDMPLLTGGSAVAMPLPRLMMGEAGATTGARGRTVATPGVVLSGSCSAMTRQQVAAYAAGAALRLDPLTLAEHGPACGGRLAVGDPSGRHAPDLRHRRARRGGRRAGEARRGRGGPRCGGALAQLPVARGGRAAALRGGRRRDLRRGDQGLGRHAGSISAKRSRRACPGPSPRARRNPLRSRSNPAISEVPAFSPRPSRNWRRHDRYGTCVSRSAFWRSPCSTGGSPAAAPATSRPAPRMVAPGQPHGAPVSAGSIPPGSANSMPPGT
jgi:rRNA maturation protein Nop10